MPQAVTRMDGIITHRSAVAQQSRLAEKQRRPSLCYGLYGPLDPLYPKQYFRDNPYLLYQHPRHQIYRSPLRDSDRLSTIIRLQTSHPL